MEKTSPQWYYAQNNQQQGPYSLSDIQAYIRAGRIQPTDLVWRQGMAAWQSAQSYPELATAFGAHPPSIPLSTSSGSSYPSITPPIKTIRIRTFINILLGTMLSALIIGFGFGLESDAVIIIGGTLAFICTISAVIYNYIVVYRAWRVLEPGGGLSPISAVLLFLPIINIVGFYFVIFGFAKRYKKIVADYQLDDAPNIKTNIYLIYTLLFYINMVIAGLIEIMTFPTLILFQGIALIINIAILVYFFLYLKETGRIIDYFRTRV